MATSAPRTEPLAYHRNLRAETTDELRNVESVFRTMDELMRVPTLTAGAVMPDACPTGAPGHIPVGGVAVAEGAIHPAMHSADVCCSVMLTTFGDADPETILNAAYATTHFGRGGRKRNPFPLPEELAERMRANVFLSDAKSLQFAASHLGTQGDGNHFLYVGRRESDGQTAVVTHHGSRALGAWLYERGMRTAREFHRRLGSTVPVHNAWIPYDTPAGQDYWEALQIVRDWTKLNHQCIHQATASRARATATDNFWNEHNFVFRDGNSFYHAKGATPLDPKFVPDGKDGLRLIPLNMAEPILIVRGETTATNLGFAPHGAGRNVSRTTHRKAFHHLTPQEVFAAETAGLDVRFWAGGIDVTELPSAYKNAAHVQAQMQEFGLGEVVDRILPYGCLMAGESRRQQRRKKKGKPRAHPKEGHGGGSRRNKVKLI